MTELELRQQYVNQLLSWRGKKESDGSHREIIDIYNNDKPLPANYKVKYTDSWCATTVSAAAIKVGITDIIPKECSCGRMIALFQKIGAWQERDDYTPKSGDIIFFDWQDTGIGDNTGWPDHVGVVASIEGDTITTIEGNIKDSVGSRTIKVNAKCIRGYGIPDYINKAKSITPSPINVPTVPTNDAASKLIGKLCKVTANTLNTREKSNTTSKIIGILKKDTKIMPIKIENGMAYFEGWISTNYIK